MARAKESSSSALQEKLRQAEEAEQTVQKLQAVAAEAPQLRAEMAKLQQAEARDRAREKAIQEAQKVLNAAAAKRAHLTVLMETTAKKVLDLYTLVRDVDSYYHEAMQSLAVADRADYEVDLEETGAEQERLGRDTKGLDYIVATRHGERRVKQMLAEMGVNLDYFKECDLSEPLRQDLANFILEHAAGKHGAAAPKETPASQRLPERPMLERVPQEQSDTASDEPRGS